MNQDENRQDLLISYRKKLIMNGIIISTDDNEAIKLFAQLAKRLGIKSKVLTEDEMLDLGLLNAMKAGRKSGYVSKEEIEIAKKYSYLAGNLTTDLHECLGHGSGQLNHGVTSESLKNYLIGRAHV